jgi:hypothetical protein
MENTAHEAGKAILKQGIRIRIPVFFGLKLPLIINPLHPGTIVHLALQFEKLQKIDDSNNMITELLRVGKNLKIHSKMVAIAAMNGPVKISIFSRVISWIVRWGVKDNEELLAYVSIVYKQMDPERFFFITTLTMGMNFLSKKEKDQAENQKAETASGVQ